MKKPSKPILKKPLPFPWITEKLEFAPDFCEKKMFGGTILCLHDRQKLFLIAKEEPWNGVLVCTSREYHDSLIMEFPQLQPHAILGKWLYISQNSEDFEAVIDVLTRYVLRNDPRIGIIGKKKKKPKKSKAT